jgi:hypothetical protein
MIVALLICWIARDMLPPNCANTIFAFFFQFHRFNFFYWRRRMGWFWRLGFVFGEFQRKQEGWMERVNLFGFFFLSKDMFVSWNSFSGKSLFKFFCICLPLEKLINKKHFPVNEKYFPVK